MTLPFYLFTKNQFIKYAIDILNLIWPVNAVRLLSLKLGNMKKTDKKEGLKMCPHIKLDDIKFIEPT